MRKLTAVEKRAEKATSSSGMRWGPVIVAALALILICYATLCNVMKHDSCELIIHKFTYACADLQSQKQSDTRYRSILSRIGT